MTTMNPIRRKATFSHREGRAGVYQVKRASDPDARWRDIAAGALFFAGFWLVVTVLFITGLIVFG